MVVMGLRVLDIALLEGLCIASGRRWAKAGIQILRKRAMIPKMFSADGHEWFGTGSSLADRVGRG